MTAESIQIGSFCRQNRASSVDIRLSILQTVSRLLVSDDCCLVSAVPILSHLTGVRVSTILVLHGPNLNLLGVREPGHYGATTLTEIDRRLASIAGEHSVRLECFQSNGEQPLIERIHRAREEGVGFIVINPAAFTHTSVALRDALSAVAIPFIEIHLSNVHAREPFRHHSYFSDIAVGVISGLGAHGYELALRAALARLKPTL
jgi:3-dehydroquinate dehydratase-2